MRPRGPGPAVTRPCAAHMRSQSRRSHRLISSCSVRPWASRIRSWPAGVDCELYMFMRHEPALPDRAIRHRAAHDHDEGAQRATCWPVAWQEMAPLRARMPAPEREPVCADHAVSIYSGRSMFQGR